MAIKKTAKKTSKKEGKKVQKRLILLDTHAILHRAFHALPDFFSSKGEPTGALYGLVTMLLKIIADLKPDYIVAAYDLPGPTYRHEAYEDYKGTRVKTDDGLVAQIERSNDIYKAFGIPVYSHPGFEADDMLGTIVEELHSNGSIDVVIASGDMDTLQLVDDKKVRVYTLKKGIKDTILYDEEGVRARFGFGPELIPDLKGIMGDASDNIPGVVGVGEGSALKLVAAYGPIENIYKAIEKKGVEAVAKEIGVQKRYVQLVADNREDADFSKMLATIRRDAPIDFKVPQKEWKDAVDMDAVKKLFSELEFRTLGSRVEAAVRGDAKAAKSAESEPAAPAPQTATLGEGLFADAGEVINRSELEETSIALWLINSNISTPTLEDIYQFAGTKNFNEARKIVLDELKRRELTFVFEEIEKPLIPIVHKMQDRGVKIDTKCLARLSKKYHAELDKLERGIWEMAGGAFNINSPKQLGQVLFDNLNLVVKGQKKTATGARSTKESELEKLKGMHPIIEKILEYREYQKLLSTYIDNIPKELNSDGRLHAEFHQAGAATGRMSSSNPNLQNIPVKSELGRNIREAFVAAEGHVLLAFDYSQIELRIAAFLSGDEKLREIFRSGQDVHAAVAAQVFNKPVEEITKAERGRAKVINFGILYGMGVNALRQNLGTSRAEAQEFYNQYFETFTTLADYLNKTKAEALRLGFTTTHFGRRRYFEGIRSSLPYIRAQAERMAINAPIQGTQADIIKLAMRRIDDYLEEEKLDLHAHLLLQVHDELIYEVKEGVADDIAPRIKKIMESIILPKETGGVVFQANASKGQNWERLESIK
ncbi:MAG TPA: DNA polymerase [Candidatus Paceibacterota bacterium]|nr:DNA polymerase [Candidatus Paceibacterota bacterium]